MAYRQRIDFYNSFLLRKIINRSLAPPSGADTEGWPSLPWYGTTYNYPAYPNFEGTAGTLAPDYIFNWYVEESRILGGFNNTSIDIGPRAYLVFDNRVQKKEQNSLIYSGVLNSKTNLNRTNVFSTAENIKRTLDPFYGSVQYLYAEDTNLIIFQENKVNSGLIDKDAIYTSEGLGITASGNTVIGQLRPYLGNWGISKNPESFATYGFRKYFIDKDRSAILRLSRDGITEISQYGMRDYFRDELAVLSYEFRQKTTFEGTLSYSIDGDGNVEYLELNTGNVCDVVEGSVLEIDFNDGNGYINVTNTRTGDWVYIANVLKQYTNKVEVQFNVAPGNSYFWSPPLPFIPGVGGSGTYNARITVPVKDKIMGGYDLHDDSYIVSLQDSINDTFSTVNYDEEVNGWVSFHSFKPLVIKSLNDSLFTFDNYEMYQHYFDKGLNRTEYYGTRYGANITFIFNDEPHVVKNFLTVDYEGSNGWQCDSIESDVEQANNWNYNLSVPYYSDWGSNFDKINRIYSYEEGAYDSAGNTPPQSYPIFRGGFDRKENQYVANMVSSSKARAGEVIFNTDPLKAYPSSGIKGYYSTVTFSTDANTQTGGKKELFSVGTRYVTSSY